MVGAKTGHPSDPFEADCTAETGREDPVFPVEKIEQKIWRYLTAGLWKTAQNVPETVELPIHLQIPFIKLVRTHLGRLEYHMRRIVVSQVEIANPSGALHVTMKFCARIRRENVRCDRFNPSGDCPVYGVTEYLRRISVESEDKTRIDHDPPAVKRVHQPVERTDGILFLVHSVQRGGIQAFKADE